MKSNKLLPTLFCIVFLTSVLVGAHQVKAAPLFSANAVWVADGGWITMNRYILTSNLSKLVHDLATNYIQYAIIFVGSWNAATNNINYGETDAIWTATINALHAVNVKVIAWAEDAGGGAMDIRASNRQNLYNSIIACMNKGFDGYNDDIEAPIGTLQDQIYYWNNLTTVLHAIGKLNMPDVAFDWQQNTNQYLHVDYIVSMFYSSRSTLEDPQAAYFWQEEFGEYSGHNTPPASPIILGIMNYYGNQNPLSWQLAQVTNYLSLYGHPQLAGFSFWLYEYMGTHTDDWTVWYNWIGAGSNPPPPPPSPLLEYVLVAVGITAATSLSIMYWKKRPKTGRR